MIPFPVNEPELWAAYVPEGITQYLRLFSAWGGEKHERLRAAGYEVVVLDEGVEKQLSGADVRAAMRSGAEWEPLVPPGVADQWFLTRPRPRSPLCGLPVVT